MESKIDYSGLFFDGERLKPIAIWIIVFHWIVLVQSFFRCFSNLFIKS